MANCNGTIPTQANNCFSTNGSITKVNCGCTPCDTPVVIQQGDVSTQVLIPVLADVIQNCMCINKYETAYPANLVFQTNILAGDAAGRVCITGVTYSYDCIGSPDDTITGFVDSKPLTLTSSQAACSCPTSSETPTPLYTKFTGSIKTNSCCCDQVDRAYALTKIVEKAVSFSVCNLSVTISGTIGTTPFTANLIGTVNAAGTGIDSLPTTPIPLDTLGFPEELNFAGRLCLPTNTKLNIEEEFDSCIIVDCIRPLTSNYTPTVGVGDYATFTTTGDLSLVINKQIYATTTEKLAVMTNSGAQVVCVDGATTTPVCPPFTPCNNSAPCPQPVARPVVE